MDQMVEIREFLRKLLSSRGDRQPFTDASYLRPSAGQKYSAMFVQAGAGVISG